MEPFRPIEANNNGQMVPQAESIWEGNYTNAAVARDAKQMLTAEMGWKQCFTTSTSCVHFLSFNSILLHVSGGEIGHIKGDQTFKRAVLRATEQHAMLTIK